MSVTRGVPGYQAAGAGFAAYFLAEKRGFAGQGAFEDWIEAEAELDEMLYDRMEKHLS